ncbi:CDP-alcohol phosphatidyltransferase family protein [Geobacter sp.]|uniref:CDP-alcohol phosphatidyltransferase family protein n=1 Tax=Geobacter sp. TaxID=46610 RepID=UPI0027B8FECB|nr:CDP-alcohol phosphatidyltransferase family protein [Geobacter sp.]
MDRDSQGFAFIQIRRFSIYLTWVLLQFPLSPNAITLMGILTGIVASVLFGLNQWIAGLIVLQFTMLFDFCDGEVSRYRNKQSKEGSYLDKLYHFSVHPAVFAGIATGSHNLHKEASWVVAVGLISSVSIFVTTMVKAYAGELAIWTHSKRLLKRLLARLEADPTEPVMLSEMIGNAVAPDASEAKTSGLHVKARNSFWGPFLNSLSSKWDFPYIFLGVSLVILTQMVVPTLQMGSVEVSPCELALLFFAVTNTFWIVFYLSYVLLTRQIQRGYESFAADLVSLLKKASQVDLR